MNILITAGGTSEKIDDVRRITNMATGRLGSLIADRFLENSDVFVTYICSQEAARPQNTRARIRTISNVQSLKAAIEEEMRCKKYEAVIHSMAVSDYTVKYSIPAKSLAERLASYMLNSSVEPNKLAEEIYSFLLSYGSEQKAGKLPSSISHMFLCLESTPKIIKLFKALQPETILVGFKLLSGVKENALLGAAENLMEKNKCDFVLANDLKNMNEKHHEAVLLGSRDFMKRLATKEEIALAIRDCVMEKISRPA